MFALQDGGWCASSAKAWDTYDKYGQSLDCQVDGEGGSWANNVYVFQDEEKCKYILVVFLSKDFKEKSIEEEKQRLYNCWAVIFPNFFIPLHWQ